MKTDDVIVNSRGVCKMYDGETLMVKYLDLDVYQDELLALLGPSSSGKTMCLMMLAGFESPTSSEIRLEGALFNNMPLHEHNIGMALQNYTLFPHMTVAQDVEYPLTVRKLPAAEHVEHMYKALQMARVEGFTKRCPAQLSGDRQQRTALAHALMFEPKLVLTDKPFGAFDKQLHEHIRYELKSLHGKFGTAFVYMIYDQGKALAMSDRMVVFDKGTIQQLDMADSLYECSCNEFAVSFVGDNNTLRDTVTRVSDDYCKLQLNDGIHVVGRDVAGANVGTTVTGCICPEHIRLAESVLVTGNAPMGQTCGLVHFGGHVRMRCTLPDQPECSVKVPLGTRALEGFTPGAPIQLEFVPKHLCVFV